LRKGGDTCRAAEDLDVGIAISWGIFTTTIGCILATGRRIAMDCNL
jgi:hypothetical protein